MSPSSHHRVLGRLLFAIGAGSAATGCGAKTTSGSEQDEDDLQDATAGASEATAAAVDEAERARLVELWQGDQATRQALLEVAEDELRHAQLAFRFIVWSLARGGEELRHTLRREVEQRLARLPEPSSTSAVSTTVLHHYGRLTPNEQRALYRQAREQLLRPAFSALLEPSRAQLNRTNSAESAC